MTESTQTVAPVARVQQEVGQNVLKSVGINPLAESLANREGIRRLPGAAIRGLAQFMCPNLYSIISRPDLNLIEPGHPSGYIYPAITDAINLFSVVNTYNSTQSLERAAETKIITNMIFNFGYDTVVPLVRAALHR